MREDSNDHRDQVKEYSDALEKIGAEISNMRFSYEVKEIASKEYWKDRIEYFDRYAKKGLEYYNQAYNIMNVVNKDQAQMFLLQISKFRQQSKALGEVMEKIMENPSIIDHKDKQQSRWSRDIKDQIVQYSDSALQQEKRMNMVFREFCDRHLKE